MSLQSLANLGVGGAGLSGAAPALAAALAELQGLTISLLAGASSNTKIDLAAIRQEDTIVAAINNNAGTLTDIANTISIVDTHASGTATLVSVAAGDTVTVAGKTYTAVAGTAKNYTEFSIAGNDTADAAALAAAINAREANGANAVTATPASNVVTVRATADGTAGNSLTLAQTGGHVTVTGATLANGTATGGIKSSNATNQVILVWFNKK